jgi:hypothetical protein
LWKERCQVKSVVSQRATSSAHDPFWRTHNTIIQYSRIPLSWLAEAM